MERSFICAPFESDCKIKMSKSREELKLRKIHHALKECRKCPEMCDRAVYGAAISTKVMLVGQAPGIHEGRLGRPFAFTAGKTLFKWLFWATALTEEELRDKIYFSAVARCFPGKAKTGSGDREPSAQEIENCREYLHAEVQTLRPTIILAVGKLAILELLKDAGVSKTTPLSETVGKIFRIEFAGVPVQVIPLPHPSGVSRWPQTEPGKTILQRALDQIGREVRGIFTPDPS